jgi:hypothetical protein
VWSEKFLSATTALRTGNASNDIEHYMVRLAGKLQRELQIMSGTTFYFGHVTNKGDAL